MQNVITGSKEGSLPTRVISVPCNVVTKGIDMPWVANICLAINAAEA